MPDTYLHSAGTGVDQMVWIRGRLMPKVLCHVVHDVADCYSCCDNIVLLAGSQMSWVQATQQLQSMPQMWACASP